jgi:hypothetical protein
LLAHLRKVAQVIKTERRVEAVVFSQVHRSTHTLDHPRVLSRSDEVQLSGKLPAVGRGSSPSPAARPCARQQSHNAETGERPDQTAAMEPERPSASASA